MSVSRLWHSDSEMSRPCERDARRADLGASVVWIREMLLLLLLPCRASAAKHRPVLRAAATA